MSPSPTADWAISSANFAPILQTQDLCINYLALQEHFNTEFSAAKQRKQAELDKILEASNHMTVIVDELAHMGVSVGNDQSSASWAPTITDDAEDSVLTVKVN